MKKLLILVCVLWIGNLMMAAENHPGYEHAMAGDDPSIVAASELGLKIPVHCREYHIWWRAPFGTDSHPDDWRHWKRERRYGIGDPQKSLVDVQPGSSWRRHLNSAGYPLLGPYDSGQEGVIRWQLRTAKATGLECLELHIWPSLWDDGQDFTPMPIIDKVFNIAAEEKFPVAIHDEIMFRRPNITKAQELQNCIRRTTAFLKRYGQHPGYYKVDGAPYYYFQNWTNWISPEDMQAWFAAVESEVGPVFWAVEMGMNEKVLQVPQLRMYCSYHSDHFMNMPPNYGMGPHDWDWYRTSLREWIPKVKAAGKVAGVNIKGRFNNTFDRGNQGRGVLPGEDGMLLVKLMKEAAEAGADQLILAQWNDFEEGGFMEPAWDFDGFNGDPYRYCRIIAATLGKTFSPVPLPPRACTDPYIRRKLYGDSRPGDLGPVMYDLKLEKNQLSWKWAKEGPAPTSLNVVADKLLYWNGNDSASINSAIRLGNFGSRENGILEAGNELRFYMASSVQVKGPVWLGVRHTLGPDTHLKIEYHSQNQLARIDSRWSTISRNEKHGQIMTLDDGSAVSWLPLENANFTGMEGDLVIKLDRGKKSSEIHEIVILAPELADSKKEVSEDITAISLDKRLLAEPVAVIPVDDIGNHGLPRLIWRGRLFAEPDPESVDLTAYQHPN